MFSVFKIVIFLVETTIGGPQTRILRSRLFSTPLIVALSQRGRRGAQVISVVLSGAMLQLRALFGIKVRCEIIIYLLTHEAAHPSRIARDAYYFGLAVQNTLQYRCAGNPYPSLQIRRKIG